MSVDPNPKDKKRLPVLKIKGKPVGRKERFAMYGFFSVHMLIFGVSGFWFAYAGSDVGVLFRCMHGAIAVVAYSCFYVMLFGLDEVKWMFINAGLGILGIYSQIGWILGQFGRKIDDYSTATHVIPFLYFILYTFLFRQAFIDLMGARENAARRRKVEILYVIISIVVYGGSDFLRR